MLFSKKTNLKKAREQERETGFLQIFVIESRHMNRSNRGTPVKKTIFDFFKSPKKRRMLCS